MLLYLPLVVTLGTLACAEPDLSAFFRSSDVEYDLYDEHQSLDHHHQDHHDLDAVTHDYDYAEEDGVDGPDQHDLMHEGREGRHRDLAGQLEEDQEEALDDQDPADLDLDGEAEEQEEDRSGRGLFHDHSHKRPRAGREDGFVPANKIDFENCEPDPDTGLCCIFKEETIKTVRKDPLLECIHTEIEKCHYTYITQFKPSQEEVCEENFHKNCQITFSKQAFNETISKCYRPLVRVCDDDIDARSNNIRSSNPKKRLKRVKRRISSHPQRKKRQGRDGKCRTFFETACTTRYVEKKTGRFVADSKCEKFPVELCGQGNCRMEPGEEECHEKQVATFAEVPEESCDLNPMKTCKFQTKLLPKLSPVEECTLVPKEVCQLKYSAPEQEDKPLLTKWCLDPNSDTSASGSRKPSRGGSRTSSSGSRPSTKGSSRRTSSRGKLRPGNSNTSGTGASKSSTRERPQGGSRPASNESKNHGNLQTPGSRRHSSKRPARPSTGADKTSEQVEESASGYFAPAEEDKSERNPQSAQANLGGLAPSSENTPQQTAEDYLAPAGNKPTNKNELKNEAAVAPGFDFLRPVEDQAVKPIRDSYIGPLPGRDAPIGHFGSIKDDRTSDPNQVGYIAPANNAQNSASSVGEGYGAPPDADSNDLGAYNEEQDQQIESYNEGSDVVDTNEGAQVHTDELETYQEEKSLVPKPESSSLAGDQERDEPDYASELEGYEDPSIPNIHQQPAKPLDEGYGAPDPEPPTPSVAPLEASYEYDDYDENDIPLEQAGPASTIYGSPAEENQLGSYGNASPLSEGYGVPQGDLLPASLDNYGDTGSLDQYNEVDDNIQETLKMENMKKMMKMFTMIMDMDLAHPPASQVSQNYGGPPPLRPNQQSYLAPAQLPGYGRGSGSSGNLSPPLPPLPGYTPSSQGKGIRDLSRFTEEGPSPFRKRKGSGLASPDFMSVEDLQFWNWASNTRVQPQRLLRKSLQQQRSRSRKRPQRRQSRHI